VIRLIAAGLLLIAALTVTIAGGRATSARIALGGLGPGAPAASFLAGFGLAVLALGTVAATTAVVSRRRYRVLATLAGAAATAAAALTGLGWLTGAWPAGTVRYGWATAAAVAVMAGVAPWLHRSWRRVSWLAVLVAVAGLLVSGTAPATELLMAAAAGAVTGSGTLVLFGVPDRRIGPVEIARALCSAGVPVAWVKPAPVEARGSRPFFAAAEDGRPLFVKVLGGEQRDADLLYRAYRFLTLRRVGDGRPAASLAQAVEHEVVAAIMAERAGVSVPPVRRVARACDGSFLVVMDRVDGLALDRLPPERIGDDLLRAVWAEVARMHRAGIAHRALRAANIVVGPEDGPWLADFSFSALAATPRQRALDIAELLASLALLTGAERAVATAVSVIGAAEVAAAAPLLQPPALSAATRRGIARHHGLLARTRELAAGGQPGQKLARVQRVRPRTLVTTTVVAGAFYFLLPQLAQVGTGWHAVQSARWAWVPVTIAFSVLSYLGATVSFMGATPGRICFWRTLLAQNAASFFNRVSPANLGGMALNVRYLQKSGIDTAAGVAAVGVSSAAGAIVHLVLMVVFFTWSGRSIAAAFRLPAGGTILLIIAITIAVAGLVLASRPGRRFAAAMVLPGLRRVAGDLRQVAGPVKMTMLFGGSALVTLSYIGALLASVMAFGGGPSIVVVCAVYLGAAAVAAAAPTPGGLGAIEAALAAGLTGVGMRPGAAVAAVLVYRLATYWLPVLPGWLAWRLLQHRGSL